MTDDLKCEYSWVSKSAFAAEDDPYLNQIVFRKSLNETLTFIEKNANMISGARNQNILN
jgi:hypothetical protein